MSRKKNDPTNIYKAGPQSYRDLQTANQEAFTNAASKSRFAGIKPNVQLSRPIDYIYEGPVASPLLQASGGEDYWGKSMWDKPTATLEEFAKLGDVRALNQPWWAKVAAGFTKGVVLAGTTFLDGTIGLLAGVHKIEENILDNDPNTGILDALWDNEFSKAMQSVNEWSEETFPNYYSSAELNRPWYENIFTANFYGDKYIKTQGYAAGAILSGGLYTAPLKGVTAVKVFGTIFKNAKAAPHVASLIGSTISAVNEGRTEALTNSTDWFNLQKQQLDDRYADMVNKQYEPLLEGALAEYEATKGKVAYGPNGEEYDPAYIKYQNAVDRINSEVQYKIANRESDKAYASALSKITEDRIKMGNATFLMNVPVLIASEYLQFGRFYARGFKTARRSANLATRTADKSAKKTGSKVVDEVVDEAIEFAPKSTVAGMAWAATKGAVSEGLEELAQKAAATTAGNYYAKDVNNFYKAKIDPKAEQETLDLWKSLAKGMLDTQKTNIDWIKESAKGIAETVSDSNSWEEFFIGALSGAIGVPTIRSWKGKDGKFRSPIILVGGVYNHWQEYRERVEREKKVAGYLNERLKDPEFLNYYRGLIRNRKFQIDMDDAAERGDAFDFKNAEHAQLVSDIIMFDSAGKLDYFESLIGHALDTSSENVQSIIKNTTAVSEDGKATGPFADNNAMSEEEAAAELTKTREAISDTIKAYKKAKERLDIQTGERLSDEQLEELTWMRIQLDNWKERGLSMSREAKKSTSKVLGSLESRIRFLEGVKDEEDQKHAGLSETYKKADKAIEILKKVRDNFVKAKNVEDEHFAEVLANNPEFIKAFIYEVSSLEDSVLAPDEKADLIKKINDLNRLGTAHKTYSSKLEEYLKNPEEQATDHEKILEDAEKEVKNKNNAAIKDRLTKAKSVAEFRAVFDEEEDTDARDEVLDSLISEGNPVAKNYKEISAYEAEVRRELAEAGLIGPVARDAIALWEAHVKAAENLEQVSNTESIHINNETAFDEDSNGDIDLSRSKFEVARYNLKQAMSKVNSSIEFKNRFSTKRNEPSPIDARAREVTRDRTVPPPYRGEVATPSPSPVGNITTDEVAEENKTINKDRDLQEPSNEGQKQYYRPAIPEIHIEASKEGDFRPFSTVVSEREQGVDFSDIYQYLEDNGAFEFVNSGGLKVGDTIKFMIDPEFEETVKDKPWHKAPTVFLVTESGQVVGSIDEGASIARYKGLASIVEKVRKEYQINRATIDAERYVTQSTIEVSSFNEVKKGDVIILSNSKVSKSTNTNDELRIDSTDGLRGIATSLKTGTQRVLDNRTLQELRRAGTEIKVRKTSEQSPINVDDFIHITVTYAGFEHLGTPQEWARGKTGDIRTLPDEFGYANGLWYFKRSSTGGRAGDNYTVWFRTEPSQKLKDVLESTVGSSYDLIEAGDKIARIIRDEQASAKAKKKFVASPQTKVSKIMVGKVPYSTEEKSLADIPGVLGEGAKPIFGIIKNGVLTTNEKVDDRLIIKPADMAKKEGRLYLLIPNAAGTYSPVAVRVKHFNSQEFNLDDTTVANTPVGKVLNSAIEQLCNCSNETDLKEAVKLLSSVLYTGNLHIDWFNSPSGSGIRITKVEKDSNGAEVYITDKEGKRVRKEEVSVIYFQNKKDTINVNGLDYSYEAAEEVGLDTSSFNQQKSTEEIRAEVLEALMKSNLPLQVDVSRINTTGYNSSLINSNVLTSNLREAKVIGSWFTTDYFDEQGNLQPAVSPSSVRVTPSSKPQSPVGGTEGVVTGTMVSVGGVQYVVDINSRTYVDDKGVKHTATPDNSNIFAMAWAQETFGDNTESSVMTENKVITPLGRVLDRNTGQYVSEEEAKRIKDKLTGKGKPIADKVAESERVLAQITDDQKRVDKTRTDGDYYYILEEDGEYHRYSRVHRRLGDNWTGPRSSNSTTSLKVGSAVDQVVRDFFDPEKTPTKPDILSEEAYAALIERLNEIKARIDKNGERFYANNIVLFYKYPDGSRVAGEVDILSVDKDGNFKIYDVKTSRYSFSDRYFTEKSSKQRMSTKDYYTLQLSAYQNLFESQYGVRPAGLAILPFVLTYDKDNKVSSIAGEEGIPITYNPAVNVPLVSTVQTPKQQVSLPIFDSTIETMITNPKEQNRVLPENAFEEGGEIGYYEKDGKLYTGYLKKVGEVGGVPIHLTKVRDKGFGREGELGSTSEYLTVFPNGKAISTRTNSSDDNKAAEVILKALSSNPEKVVALASEKTQISKETEKKPDTPSTPSGAAKAVRKDAEIERKPPKRRRPKLREAKGRELASNKPVNIERELKWLKKAFPWLSKENRIRIAKGLIQVASNGPVAWGMYSDGIITLSDIAAKGTVYHEAFHLVMDLMLTEEEKQALFEEARATFGDKSLDELEEDMAEGFREYMMTQENRSLGKRILDFFKNLFAKVTNWKYIKPSLTSYYRMIDQGRYSKRSLSKSDTTTKLRQEEYSSEMNTIKEQAIKDGTFMKAPNGNPTNLTERQWLQVRTKAFKDWFGDWENNPSKASKVIDENGEPLVVYHNTKKDKFNTFKPNSESIIYFTSDKQYANDLKGGRQYEVFLNIKNPIDTRNTYLDDESGVLYSEEEYKNLEDDYTTYPTELSHNNIYLMRQGQNIYKLGDGLIGHDEPSYLRNDLGYDVKQLKSKGNEYVVFDSNQIKSATSNTGEFSTTNNDIRYREIPNSSWSAVDSSIRQALEAKGWTQEKFNSISQAERDNAIDCVGL